MMIREIGCKYLDCPLYSIGSSLLQQIGTLGVTLTSLHLKVCNVSPYNTP